MEKEQPLQEGGQGGSVVPLSTWRSLEVSPEMLRKELGKEIQECLAALRPALIPWDLTKEQTAFFLHHLEDLTKILSFVSDSAETDDREKALSPAVRWYLQELRWELREIIESGAVKRGIGSRFAIENRPVAPIRPQDWHPKTLIFIERLRPKLAGIFKAYYIDHWLQTPLDTLGGFSPIQMIENGGGSRVLALVKEMEFQGVT